MKRFVFNSLKCWISLLCCILFLNSSIRAENVVLDQLNVELNKSTILSVQFPKSLNPRLSSDSHIFKGKNNLFYATLPTDLDTTFLNIEVLSSVNSSVKINGEAITGQVGYFHNQEVLVNTANVDIMKLISIELTDELGRSFQYEVLAQKGIWQIDSLVYQFKDKYNIPGVSVAVANIKQTSTEYKSGYGFAVLDSKIRVQPNSLFRLASMSKQHTAIAILKLVEDGKFGLDDYVFGPGGILKNEFPDVPAKAGRIKVRHLLEHTSGYSRSPDYIYGSQYTGWSTERRIRALLKARQPNEPGTVYAYYNTGYAILGYIVEVVSGKHYEQFLKELYANAGITDIHVGSTQNDRRDNEVAYYSQNGASSFGVDMDVRASSGGLIASTEQLFKLLWAIDGNPNIEDILTKETIDMMFTASKVGESRYALGWRANHNFFPESFYHGGTLTGVATFWIYSKDYAAVVLCNSRSYRSTFDDDLYRMAAKMIEEIKLLGL